MTKQCIVCGKPFEPKSRRQLMCSADCQRERNKWRCKKYNDAHGYEPDKYAKALGVTRREYFRIKRKQYRKTERKTDRHDFTADGYAERQKQKSLELAGKVSTTL